MLLRNLEASDFKVTVSSKGHLVHSKLTFATSSIDSLFPSQEQLLMGILGSRSVFPNECWPHSALRLTGTQQHLPYSQAHHHNANSIIHILSGSPAYLEAGGVDRHGLSKSI